MTISVDCGLSSSTMSVPQVSRIKTRPSLPSGVLIVCPTPNTSRCRTRVGAIPHLEINDLDARAPSGCEDACSRSNGFLNTGYINSSAVEHPALGAKVVLHVDDDHCGLRGINRNRAGLRIERDSMRHGLS